MYVDTHGQLEIFSRERLNKELLSTNASSHRYPIQRWANFIAGFSIEFVEDCLQEFHPQDGTVLDPYAGCGTTLIAAKNLGFQSIGYDPHIVFSTLCRAKMENYSMAELVEIHETFLASKTGLELSRSPWDFLNKLFSTENLAKILKVSKSIEMLRGRQKDLAVTIFLKACELSCTAQTDGIYKAPDSKKKALDFDVSLEKTFELFAEDISCTWYDETWKKQPVAKHYLKSSEEMKEVRDNAVCCIVTSPPYLNNFDYAEMTRMQLYLLKWADGWSDVSRKVRTRLVTNTTTAIAEKRRKDVQSNERTAVPEKLHEELDLLVEQLDGQRRKRPGKKPYHFLVYPYYAQITRTLREAYRVLKHDGKIHWVVSDAALYGIHVATEEHTARIMSVLGFKNVHVVKLRDRGDRWVLKKRDGSKKGLGEYHVTGVK